MQKPLWLIPGLFMILGINPMAARAEIEGNAVSAKADSSTESAVQSVGVAPLIRLPDTPQPQKTMPSANRKVVDKKFIAVMGLLGGAESLRFTTHKLVLDHEFAAGAPWITSVPPNRRLVAKYGAMFAAENLVVYELKKSHDWLPGDKVIRKLWWAYPLAMAPIHLKNAVGSIRTQPPSCPVQECAAQ